MTSRAGMHRLGSALPVGQGNRILLIPEPDLRIRQERVLVRRQSRTHDSLSTVTTFPMSTVRPSASIVISSSKP